MYLYHGKTDETPALKRKKVCNPNEPICKRNGGIQHGKKDSRDVNMGRAKCKPKEMTQVRHALRARASFDVKIWGKHSTPKANEIKKNGRRRFRYVNALYRDKRSLKL